MLGLESYKYVIVGAGLWGCVLAERVADCLDERVLVVDRRRHCGGNCHSAPDEETGIECHLFGTHIFHTREQRVWEYLNRFTTFNTYRHRVLTEYGNKLYQMPIGLATINSFYGMNLKPHEAESFIAAQAARENISEPANLEEKAISLIGRPLYEAFIKGYTWKQWRLPPDELPADIITRLPVRADYNPEYFNDYWQGLPLDGYHSLFERLLEHPNITLRLGLDYADIAAFVPSDCRIFYSGPIDAFFHYRLGELSWRSLRCEKKVLPFSDYQGNSVINQSDPAVPYTRTHEFRHLHPERTYTKNKTVVVYEYPEDFCRGREAYYPVNRPEDQRLLRQYRELASVEAPRVTFGGRLGRYIYADMDTTVSNALDAFAALAAELGMQPPPVSTTKDKNHVSLYTTNTAVQFAG